MNNKDRQEIRRVIAVLEMGDDAEMQQEAVHYDTPRSRAIADAVEGLKVLIGEVL